VSKTSITLVGGALRGSAPSDCASDGGNGSHSYLLFREGTRSHRWIEVSEEIVFRRWMGSHLRDGNGFSSLISFVWPFFSASGFKRGLRNAFSFVPFRSRAGIFVVVDGD
jgi:hypothetical protein